MHKELLKESWSKVLMENYEKGLLDEGFKDVYNKTSEYLGFKNDNRDQYKQAQKTQGTGGEGHGSLGISMLNGVNNVLARLTGSKYDNIRGGYFDKTTKKNHGAEVNGIKQRVQSLMVNMLSYLTLCRYLANDENGQNKGLQASKLKLVQNPVSMKGRRNNAYVLQLVNFNTNKLGKDMIQGQSNINSMGQGTSLTTGFKVSEQECKEVLKKCLIPNPKVPKNYQWLQRVFNATLSSAIVDGKWLGGKIKSINDKLNAIDININKYLWSKNIRDVNALHKDAEFQQLIQQKTYVVNSEFQQIMAKVTNEGQWALYLQNGKNVTPWFINVKALIGMFTKYKEMTDEKFMETIGRTKV